MAVTMVRCVKQPLHIAGHPWRLRTAEHSGLCERDRTNLGKIQQKVPTLRACLRTGGHLLGPTYGGLEQTPPWRFVLATLPLVPGYFASRAYLKFLKEADELLRNVHYEAASKSFILVILLGIVYYLASQVFGEWEDAGASSG